VLFDKFDIELEDIGWRVIDDDEKRRRGQREG
jgi:hypothetical protein